MTADSLEARFSAQMGQLLGPDFPKDIALAVSGGGDSMALLALAHGWARVWGVRLWVVTVDHGLRAESAAEAAMVAAECAALGHPHATLRWHWDGRGNLMQAARRARLDLIDRWRRGICHVLTAHTRDDVAETFLMRLSRGSGVEGLAAMHAKQVACPNPHVRPALPEADLTQTAVPPAPVEQDSTAKTSGFCLIRPLLAETRADLRHYTDTLRLPVVDDPGNDNPTFDRSRIRRLLAVLEAEGLGPGTLANSARRMRRAAEALGARAAALAGELRRDGASLGTPTGDLIFDRDGFGRVERDSQMRLLADALCEVSSIPLRPRERAVEDALDRALGGAGGTLHGCEIRVSGASIRVLREFAAVRDKVATGTDIWDTRWRLHGPTISGGEIRALGDDGWRQIPDQPEGAAPFALARTLPAIFDGDRLIACRALRFGPDHAVELRPYRGAFVAFGETD